jgi:leucyl-tRNA synthetase
VRSRIAVPRDAAEADVLAAARIAEGVAGYLDGKSVRRQVVVPGRLVNFVV